MNAPATALSRPLFAPGPRPRALRAGLIVAFLFIAFVLGAVALVDLLGRVSFETGHGVGFGARTPGVWPVAPAWTKQPASSQQPSEERAVARALSHAFARAASRVAPSVVSVVSERWSFGRGGPAFGSGFIADPDGIVVTNAHVVAGARSLDVILADGRRLRATPLGVDRATDVAALKIDAHGLEPVEFGDSDELATGEWVLALGSPYGLARTVTAGIVSATGRTGLGVTELEDFVQTDAAVNPGNSGGPLVDLEGRVVGMNSAILSSSGANAGIGLAVSSNLVRAVLEDLRLRGRSTRGFLGVTLAPVPGGKGAEVVSVRAGSPAERAGLSVGDVILSVGDEAVADPRSLARTITRAEAGSTVELTVQHHQRTRRIVVELGERESDMP
jgi:serine protease Do